MRRAIIAALTAVRYSDQQPAFAMPETNSAACGQQTPSATTGHASSAAASRKLQLEVCKTRPSTTPFFGSGGNHLLRQRAIGRRSSAKRSRVLQARSKALMYCHAFNKSHKNLSMKCALGASEVPSGKPAKRCAQSQLSPSAARGYLSVRLKLQACPIH